MHTPWELVISGLPDGHGLHLYARPPGHVHNGEALDLLGAVGHKNAYLAHMKNLPVKNSPPLYPSRAEMKSA